MPLQDTIEDIQKRIKAGQYSNEAAVSQGIVLRLLQALDWPIADTQIVCPEYALESRRVDFALCHPATKPIAFIEVKQIGQTDGGERQLFEYAFHVGVPLAILTDGQEWNFYLPAEQGDYGERRVYKLDIIERELEECINRFGRYLSFAAITSGRAITSAREDYQNISRNRQIHAQLPAAWSKLVADEDDLLLELIADQVANLCGFKPSLDTVAKFLKENIFLRAPHTPPEQAPPLRRAPTESLPTLSSRSTQTVGIGFKLDGHFTPCRNGRDVLVKVFEALSELDSTFLERFASRPKHGRTRRYLARTSEELYPGRLDLAREHSFRLKPDWFIGTNVSKAQIERIIEMGCEVAHIRLGKDLIINVGE